MLKFTPLLLFIACTGADPIDEPTEPPDPVDTGDEPGGDDAAWHCIDRAWTATADGPDAWTVATEHYDLRWEGTQEEAEEAAKILEMAWLGMDEYWQANPGSSELLKVRFFADETAWADAILADGSDVPIGAGGYYWPPTKTAFFYRQPTIYYNHTLMIHEVVHQFHDLTGNPNNDLPSWYVEGLAEYLGRHDWDGRCGRLGRLPLVSRDDIADKALARWGSTSLSEVLDSSGPADRPLAWAFVRYMEAKHGEGWTKAREGADQALGPINDLFREELGDPDAYTRDFSGWLAAEQEIFEPVYLEWIHRRPDEVIGFAEGVSTIAPANDPTGTFAARMHWDSGYAGVLTGFTDSQNWTALFVTREGAVSSFVVTYNAVAWDGVSEVGAVADGASLRWDGTALSVGSARVPWDEPHTLNGGMAAYDAEVRFAEITVED